MKDFLQDLVAHTYSLGVIPLIRITANKDETLIDGVAEDKTLVLNGQTKIPVTELDGVFGMPNLNKLDNILKCSEYKENAKLVANREDRNGEVIHTDFYFENEAGDFQNFYRLMKPEIINAKLKTTKFKGATYDIEFEPNVASIQRLKFQQSVHSEEIAFNIITDNGNLVFKFGDANTHAGSFVFEANIQGKLRTMHSYPVDRVLKVLDLAGDKTISIADGGLMKITVDSGIAEYNYMILALTK